MDSTQDIVRQFIVDAIRRRICKSIPSCPETIDELSARVAEGLIYLSFLPHVLAQSSGIKRADGNAIPYRDIVKVVADEVYVAISEYLNGGDRLDPRFPVHASSYIHLN